MAKQKLYIIPEPREGRVILTVGQVKAGIEKAGSIAAYAKELGIKPMAFYQALGRAGIKVHAKVVAVSVEIETLEGKQDE